MKYAVRLHRYNYQNAVVDFEQQVNVERLRTMYDGDLSNIQAEINILDPRRFTSKQRRLYWSLLSDIYNWSGQGVNELHDWFKQEYAIKYYELVSLSDESNNTVSDINKLIDIVINFMFEYNVPFKKGYELLPKNEAYYLYACCIHRKCAVCGKSNSDIHHVDTVGMGNNRNKFNHLESRFICLCRNHHTEAHSVGLDEFLSKHHINTIRLDFNALNKLGMINSTIRNTLQTKGDKQHD